jgi:hypothetical protein
MWSDIWAFIRAFGHRSTSLMSGSLSVPFAIWAALSEGWQRVSLALLSVLCFLVGSFVVWQQERRRAEAAETRLAEPQRLTTWATIEFRPADFGHGSDAPTPTLRDRENVAAVLSQGESTFRVVWSRPFRDENYQVRFERDEHCLVEEKRAQRRPDSVLLGVYLSEYHKPGVVTVTATGPSF